MRKTKRRSDCPINFALELFGDKWTLLVIRDLMFKGKHYYSEFMQSEEKIATNILADKLELLESSGIVKKTVDPSHASKFIYQLTAMGIDIVPVLVDLIVWSSKYDDKTASDFKFVKKALRDREKLIKEIEDKLKLELKD